MRRAARVDANHSEIVQGLRKAGCSVLDLSRVGQGCPDICVGFGGINLLMEIKDGSKSPSARKLTVDEVKFHRGWSGAVTVVNSLEDAIKQINAALEVSQKI